MAISSLLCCHSECWKQNHACRPSNFVHKSALDFCRSASASQTSSMQRGELLGNNNIYADILSLCGEASGDHSGKILEAMVLQCSRAGADNWQNCINSVSNNSSNYLPLLHPNDMHLWCSLEGPAYYWTIRLQHQDYSWYLNEALLEQNRQRLLLIKEGHTCVYEA